MRVRRSVVAVLLLLIVSAGWLGLVLAAARARTPAVILKELGTLTPLGSDVPAVEAAIQRRGLHPGMCWQQNDDGRKTAIMVRYSNSLGLGLPPPRTIIEATWQFDADGKLRDICLDYYRGGFIDFGFTKETDKPYTLTEFEKD